MTVVFRGAVWTDYVAWSVEDPKVLARLNTLIEECRRHPFTGTGKPEPLRQTLASWWSRRITGEHRLIYRVRWSGAAQVVEIRPSGIAINRH